MGEAGSGGGLRGAAGAALTASRAFVFEFFEIRFGVCPDFRCRAPTGLC